MPISRAVAFMSFAKSSWLPLMCSAMATAASLPEQSSSPYSSVSSVSFSPTFRYMEEPSVYAASQETVTTSFRSPSRIATRAVRILVVLAISIFASAFCSYNTRPLSTSIKIAEEADVLTACV